VLDTLEANNWMGDKGYVGNDMITPIMNGSTDSAASSTNTATPPELRTWTSPKGDSYAPRGTRNAAGPPTRRPRQWGSDADLPASIYFSLPPAAG
jgi:hypothetical protein